jgi:hypothetical protein
MVPELKNEQIYDDLVKTIQNAGGKVYDKINYKILAYVPLKDCPQNK